VLELFQFQRTAASQIADRYTEYVADPATTGRSKSQKIVPFYQALSSITGSGKTAILAQAICEISALSEISPVVLWLSKGKVVVAQSFANIAGGGKYNHLLGDSSVRLLSEYRGEDVENAREATIYFATVGTFNHSDRATSNLRVFASEIDTTETSIWEGLKERLTAEGERRPLVVVYDEAQNLSNQQTDLLLELEPAAFLLASATLKFPDRFRTEVIEQLRSNDLSDEELVTSIPSAVVVQSGLVKSTVTLAGLNSPMQETVSAMLAEMAEAEAEAKAEGLTFKPKAIYVSNTNVVESDDGLTDDPKQDFLQREAPPILIWRHLTEKCGINANEIAVYADLRTHRDFPLPDEFVLFSGGESDYDTFVAGDYRHVIFNLTLQEGWDDPAVYFAYIDKSMNSKVQITQIVGRVLRQPGAKHYISERLNTAHFHVRLDRNEAFTEVVEEVRKGIGGDAPEVRFVTVAPGKEAPIAIPSKQALLVPRTALDNDEAKDAVAATISKLNDYTNDTSNTRATGRRRTMSQKVGEGDAVGTEWTDFEHTSEVSARWVFRREVSRSYRPALAAMITDSPKFDAKVGVGSVGYKHVESIASEAVDEYLSNAVIKQVGPKPYQVGTILVRPSELVEFTNAVHRGYDGLNALELPFARALDALGHTWCRNPSQTGYKIPLISRGATAWFFPDFLLWVGDGVLCIDTKGEHLIGSDAGRKLLSVVPHAKSQTTLSVHLVSRGRWNSAREMSSQVGFTVWGLKQDQTLRTTHYDDLEAVAKSFLPKSS
jgi:type III restriction enzyme